MSSKRNSFSGCLILSALCRVSKDFAFKFIACCNMYFFLKPSCPYPKQICFGVSSIDKVVE